MASPTSTTPTAAAPLSPAAVKLLDAATKTTTPSALPERPSPSAFSAPFPLPPDLHHKILGELDLPSLLRLRATSTSAAALVAHLTPHRHLTLHAPHVLVALRKHRLLSRFPVALLDATLRDQSCASCGERDPGSHIFLPTFARTCTSCIARAPRRFWKVDVALADPGRRPGHVGDPRPGAGGALGRGTVAGMGAPSRRARGRDALFVDAREVTSEAVRREVVRGRRGAGRWRPYGDGVASLRLMGDDEMARTHLWRYMRPRVDDVLPGFTVGPSFIQT